MYTETFFVFIHCTSARTYFDDLSGEKHSEKSPKEKRHFNKKNCGKSVENAEKTAELGNETVDLLRVCNFSPYIHGWSFC